MKRHYVGCAFGLFAPWAALAQNAPAPEADATGSEIIVTAQKRAQRTSDVGLTIVTQSAAQLRASGVVDVTQLARVVPGFSATQSNDGYPIFSIRGVNFNVSQVAAAPAVSSYIDQASLPYTSMTGGLLLDVERIEVLKGPQGTLFGQNATGGSINVIAAKPTRDFAAGAQFSLNNFGQVDLDGYVSGPVTANLLARVAVATTQEGAWQRGYFGTRSRHGDADRGAARLLLDWTPTDMLRVSLNVNGNYDKGEPQLKQLGEVAPNNPAAVLPALLTYPLPPRNARAADIDPGFKNRSDNNLFQSVLRIDHDIGDNFVATSLTNYVQSRFRSIYDLDATSLSILFQDVGGKVKSFNQEIRLSGSIPNIKANVIVGANYQHDQISDSIFLDARAFGNLPYGTTLRSEYDELSRAAAVFVNADIEVAPRFSVTGGARYTWTKQTLTGCTKDSGDGTWSGVIGGLSGLFRSAEGLAPLPAGTFVPGGCATMNDLPSEPGGNASFAPFLAEKSQTPSNLSWRAGVNYKPSHNTLIYALISRGYKAGNFPVVNAVVASQYRTVKQEQLTSYEVGTKLPLLPRILYLNLSAFHYDYRDKQFYTYVPSALGATNSQVNIPNSKVTGFDADLTLNITHLSLRGAVTYVRTKIGNFVGYDQQLNLTDFGGNVFNFAPKWSGSADAEYRTSVSSRVEAFAGAGLVFNSSTYSDLANAANTKLPAYALIDLRTGARIDGRHQIMVWVRNMTNKYYWTNFINSGDTFTKFTGRPRTYGVTLRAEF